MPSIFQFSREVTSPDLRRHSQDRTAAMGVIKCERFLLVAITVCGHLSTELGRKANWAVCLSWRTGSDGTAGGSGVESPPCDFHCTLKESAWPWHWAVFIPKSEGAKCVTETLGDVNLDGGNGHSCRKLTLAVSPRT